MKGHESQIAKARARREAERRGRCDRASSRTVDPPQATARRPARREGRRAVKQDDERWSAVEQGGDQPFGRILPGWWPRWDGEIETLVIVAGGPSAGEVDFSGIQGQKQVKVVVINNSWRLHPVADILYACDFKWWEVSEGGKGFGGLKLSVDGHCSRHPEWGVRKVGLNKADDRLELVKFGTVGWAGNGGFHCLNLGVQFAVHFGFRKIVLVGYDMTLDRGVHWHGKHGNGMNNPTPRNVERWRRCIDACAEIISAMGIKVINTSSFSALQNYPKVPFAEAVKC